MTCSSSSLDQNPTKKKKTTIRFVLALVFLSFLVGVILFSQNSLEPTSILYTEPSSQDPARMRIISSPQEPHKNKSSSSARHISDLERNVTLTQMPKWGIDAADVSGQEESAEEEKSVLADVKCDLYSGSWVRDEDGGYPLYFPETCLYVEDAYSCHRNGRTDDGYLKWRWKPHGCELPRFNATRFLERIRGKKLMLVGDSMNRNQYESLLCMLHQSLPDKTKMYETRGNKITKGRGYFSFKFMDYNCTVDYCRSHFLVREGKRINGQGNSNPILKIDQIGKSSSRWKHADILVFNTGHWWAHGKTSKGKNYYQEGDFIHPRFDVVEAYKIAMRTWARWIDQNMDAKKHMVFYRGYSTAHFRGGDWDSGGTCQGESKPILTGQILENYPLKMKIVEEAIHEMQFPVIFLNVTRLTNYRKDGHPSIYGKIRKKDQKVSAKKQDCSHWCLPGIPDAWNELIYVNLILIQQNLALT